MKSTSPQKRHAIDAGNRSSLFDEVLREIPDPSSGLPPDVFSFALAITPMINVDLLVTDMRGVLLAWRNDDWGCGWHVPGGIIRLNEAITDRISEVARLELGTTVTADPAPVALSQFFAVRGHFVSLLYRCVVSGKDAHPMAYDLANPRPGELGWFKTPPKQIYPAHIHYIPRLAEFGSANPVSLTEPPITLR